MANLDPALIITAVATVAAAVGTPTLTWAVLTKMSKIQINKMQEVNALQITQINEINSLHLQNMRNSCEVCKKALEGKIEDVCGDLEEVSGRQQTLREKDLPEKYVRKTDCEKCEKRLKDEVEVAHKRISEYHPKKGGTGGP